MIGIKILIFAATLASTFASRVYAQGSTQVSPDAEAFVAASTIPLTMEQAIQKAIQNNLTVRIAQAKSAKARGQAIQDAASLLPRVTGSLSQARVFKANLAAQGFGQSDFLPNPLIGPYDSFDARIRLVQNLLDMASIWRSKAASADVHVAGLEEDLASEQVASAAALAYIENLRAIRSVQDAQANLDLGQKLLTLAHHQRDAGLATYLDVARAETREAQERKRFIQAQLSAALAELRLKRIVGIPLASFLALDGRGDDAIAPGPAEASAIAQARADRVELRITEARLQSVTYALKEARAGHMPTLSAAADYGFSGTHPDDTARTGSIGGLLEFPIFSGRTTRGKIEEAKGRQSEAQSQQEDIRVQVEEDVILALHTLSAEFEEVGATEIEVELAKRELKLAQDRYSAGVGDNIQVVTAQASSADAHKSRVEARARYWEAQASLAMALGHMRTFHFGK